MGELARAMRTALRVAPRRYEGCKDDIERLLDALDIYESQRDEARRQLAEQMALCGELVAALREAIRTCPRCLGDGRLMYDEQHRSIAEPWERLPICPVCGPWRTLLATPAAAAALARLEGAEG